MKIADLRKRLAELESAWTEEDNKVMGLFGDQEIYVPVYQWDHDKEAAIFKGYGRDIIVYWDVTGLGLFIEDGRNKNSQ